MFGFFLLPLVSTRSILVVFRRKGAGDAASLIWVVHWRLVWGVVLCAVVHGNLGVYTGTQHVWGNIEGKKRIGPTWFKWTFMCLKCCGSLIRLLLRLLSEECNFTCINTEYRWYLPQLLLLSEKIKTLVPVSFSLVFCYYVSCAFIKVTIFLTVPCRWDYNTFIKCMQG